MADKPEWKLNGQMLTMTFPLEETIVTIKVEEHTSYVYCTLHVGLKIYIFHKIKRILSCPIYYPMSYSCPKLYKVLRQTYFERYSICFHNTDRQTIYIQADRRAMRYRET